MPLFIDRQVICIPPGVDWVSGRSVWVFCVDAAKQRSSRFGTLWSWRCCSDRSGLAPPVVCVRTSEGTIANQESGSVGGYRFKGGANTPPGTEPWTASSVGSIHRFKAPAYLAPSRAVPLPAAQRLYLPTEGDRLALARRADASIRGASRWPRPVSFCPYRVWTRRPRPPQLP